MTPAWTVPPIWTGQTVVVLAGGPSLTQSLPLVEAAVARGAAKAIAVNNAFAIAPWAEWLHAADASWWSYHAQAALKFEGIKTAAQEVSFRNVHFLRPLCEKVFTTDTSCIAGRNSAHQAAVIAMHAGSARVVLCGVDCHSRTGSHWHGDHPSALRNTTETAFATFIRGWAALAKVAPVEIINCSPGSSVTCFKQELIDKVL